MMDRKAEERDFHNRLRTVEGDPEVAATRWSPFMEETIATNPLWVNMKYYAIERKSRDLVLNWFTHNCPGKRVLDYCCGNGEDGFFIAGSGAREVVGIDISDISVENCRRTALTRGLHNISYLVRDAEETGFEDNSFDIITEYGALHHLDLERAFDEMRRILRPRGAIICNEALGHNPIIHLYRRCTPRLRTEWEVNHILRKDQFCTAAKYFADIRLHFFHLATLLAVPFRNTPFFPTLLAATEAIDGLLLKMPVIKWQAWQVVFTLAKPIK